MDGLVGTLIANATIEVPQLGHESTVADLAGAMFARAAVTLAEREPGLRHQGDPEDVHQARVALRRLRAELRTLRPVLDRSWADELNGELKWLAAALGQVRDTDVRIEQLHREVARLPEADAVAAKTLIGRLYREREVANAHLLVILETDRYRDLIRRIVAAAHAPVLKPGDPRADAPARTVVPDLVAERWRNLRRGVDHLDRDPSDETLHEIRKRAKKLRYAAEAATAVVGPQATKLAHGAEKVQNVLGEVHDAGEMERWLRHDILALGSVSTAVAGGALIERQRRRHRHQRNQWPKVWRHARQKRRRSWLKSATH
jgi:CHAD domain-containing protein